MASGGTTFAGGEVTDLGTKPPDSLGAEETFDTRWRSLVAEVRRTSRRSSVDERLDPEHYRTAVRLAREHPDEVRVRGGVTEDFSEMGPHVRTHFDDLFNDDSVCPAFKGPRPEAESLLELAELVYLHDASSRFADRREFEPTRGGLEAISFVEFPAPVAEWLEGVDVVWEAANGNIDLSESALRERIADLYERRAAYVSRSVANGTFLPVAPPADVPTDCPDIVTAMRRGSVDPKRVHGYLFEHVSELM